MSLITVSLLVSCIVIVKCLEEPLIYYDSKSFTNNNNIWRNLGTLENKDLNVSKIVPLYSDKYNRSSVCFSKSLTSSTGAACLLNIDLDISPQNYPDLTIMVDFYTDSMSDYGNGRQWILSNDDIDGGFDRGVIITDGSYGGWRKLAIGGVGHVYGNSSLVSDLNKWTRVIAKYDHNGIIYDGIQDYATVYKNDITNKNGINIQEPYNNWKPGHTNICVNSNPFHGGLTRYAFNGCISMIKIYGIALNEDDIDKTFKGEYDYKEPQQCTCTEEINALNLKILQLEERLNNTEALKYRINTLEQRLNNTINILRSV